MAGLELLFTCVSDRINSPHDAVVCFVHWEMISSGFLCLGTGDEPRATDKKSELLPPDWSSNKDVYTLRYQEKKPSADQKLLLKGVTVDSTLIFNLMNLNTHQLSDLTVNVLDHVDIDHLHTFDSVFKDVDSLSRKVKSQLLTSQTRPTHRGRSQREDHQEEEEQMRRRQRGGEGEDPLGVPIRHPHPGTHPHWSRSGGGMIMDPMRSGFRGPGFDPTRGIPDVLPPGAVPPGARFDPFGPIGRGGPDPDHLPPPGFDDMFM
uniref:Proteasome inhibitor PI31 subunit n=1 Tax=Cynoglossus semilaevis TaxID=244447 RepID=A0A3P8WYT5_CYNSE